MVFCGDCGSRYGSKVWHANDKYRKIIWQCNRKYAGTICKSPHLTDPQIEDIVMRAMGKLSDERDAIIRTAVMLRDTIYDTSALCAEQECVERELADATDQLTQAVLRFAFLQQVEACCLFCLMDRYSCSSLGFDVQSAGLHQWIFRRYP